MPAREGRSWRRTWRSASKTSSTKPAFRAKRIRKELARRWKTVDKVGRENAFVMAIAALGVGIVVGYLLSRDDD